jgi:hypothetical protein
MKLQKNQRKAISTQLIEEGLLCPITGDLLEDDQKILSFIKLTLKEKGYKMSLKRAIKSLHNFQSYTGNCLISHSLKVTQ